MREEKRCCDNCACYRWYYDWCELWKSQVDGRSVYDCWKEEWNGRKYDEQKGLKIGYGEDGEIVRCENDGQEEWLDN